MEPPAILSALLELAARLGVTVRIEPFGQRAPQPGSVCGRGGLCWLRGRPTVMIDARLPTLDRIGILADALAAFDLAFVHVPPALRTRVAKARRAGTAEPRARQAPEARVTALRPPVKAVPRAT